jgi:hypothetical protein
MFSIIGANPASLGGTGIIDRKPGSQDAYDFAMTVVNKERYQQVQIRDDATGAHYDLDKFYAMFVEARAVA